MNPCGRDPGNSGGWSCGRVPLSADDVFITLLGSVDVTAVGSTVNSLTLSTLRQRVPFAGAQTPSRDPCCSFAVGVGTTHFLNIRTSLVVQGPLNVTNANIAVFGVELRLCGESTIQSRYGGNIFKTDTTAAPPFQPTAITFSATGVSACGC